MEQAQGRRSMVKAGNPSLLKGELLKNLADSEQKEHGRDAEGWVGSCLWEWPAPASPGL